MDYFDAVLPGLVLRVSFGGTKTWRALHYVKVDGKTKPRTYKLGRYPTLDLKQAREKARQFLADPQKAREKAAEGSFKEVAENFIKRHVEASGLRSEAEIKRCLAKYVYPLWRDRPFTEIRRGEVAALLDRIEDENGKRQADYVLAIIRKIMNWYAARHDDYSSPIVRGMQRSKPAERKRERILNDDEIRAVWETAPAVHPSFAALLKLLLLTAQRREKVATMRWADIDDIGVWTIPTEQREKSNAEVLRLPKMALEVIASQPRIAGNPYVLPGSKVRRRPANGQAEPPAFGAFSQRKEELDAERKKTLPNMPPWTFHDLRRTARSLMSRAGIRPDISERVLGHAIPGVEGVYDRHRYDDEKAQALKQLAALIVTILNPPEGNVVALR